MQQNQLTAETIINALAAGSVSFSPMQRTIAARLLLQQPAREQPSGAPHLQLAAYRSGERVEFTHDGRPVLGVVQRINAKTVGVLTDDGREWRVPPRLLRKAPADAPPAPAPQPPATSGFRVGEPVTFKGRGGQLLSGIVTRVNAKTVSVETANGDWRVSPRALQKQAPAAQG